MSSSNLHSGEGGGELLLNWSAIAHILGILQYWPWWSVTDFPFHKARTAILESRGSGKRYISKERFLNVFLYGLPINPPILLTISYWLAFYLSNIIVVCTVKVHVWFWLGMHGTGVVGI